MWQTRKHVAETNVTSALQSRPNNPRTNQSQPTTQHIQLSPHTNESQPTQEEIIHTCERKAQGSRPMLHQPNFEIHK